MSKSWRPPRSKLPLHKGSTPPKNPKGNRWVEIGFELWELQPEPVSPHPGANVEKPRKR